jgi:hypothetical protein
MTSTNQTQIYQIGAQLYADLANAALQLFGTLDFEDWSETLADDIEYYFPNNVGNTRVNLIGRSTVFSYWERWKQDSGVSSSTISLVNTVPVFVVNPPVYAGLPGNWAFQWFNNDLIINGISVTERMHCTVHFNKFDKIDRYYTYYDRTAITAASNPFLPY